MPPPRFLRLPISYGKFVGTKLVAPPDGLEVDGPRVSVKVSLHRHAAQALRAKGVQVPAPVEGRALIDSGATKTTIDKSVADSLKLQASGLVTSYGVGGKSEGITVGCSIDIRGLVVDIPRAHCHDLSRNSSGLIALIGRDVLRHMVFHYDGITGQIYLELPNPNYSPPQKAGPGKKDKKTR